MFVYYFIHIDRPFDHVEPELLRILPGLRGWAEQAYREGEGLRARVGTHSGVVAKTVDVDVGTPLRGESETWIPLRWEASGAPSLFPRMEADIVIGAIGDHLTQLALRGSYSVPMGRFGRALDRMLLHRVAEASVKAFIDRIAAAVEQGLEERTSAR